MLKSICYLLHSTICGFTQNELLINIHMLFNIVRVFQLRNYLLIEKYFGCTLLRKPPKIG